jgi:hypothetical protein
MASTDRSTSRTASQGSGAPRRSHGGPARRVNEQPSTRASPRDPPPMTPPARSRLVGEIFQLFTQARPPASARTTSRHWPSTSRLSRRRGKRLRWRASRVSRKPRPDHAWPRASNHDTPPLLRFGPPKRAAAVLSQLRGTPFLYAGEGHSKTPTSCWPSGRPGYRELPRPVGRDANTAGRRRIQAALAADAGARSTVASGADERSILHLCLRRPRCARMSALDRRADAARHPLRHVAMTATSGGVDGARNFTSRPPTRDVRCRCQRPRGTSIPATAPFGTRSSAGVARMAAHPLPGSPPACDRDGEQWSSHGPAGKIR